MQYLLRTRLLCTLFYGVFYAGIAPAQIPTVVESRGESFAAKKVKPVKPKQAPLVMKQLADGKWVIMNRGKKTLYEVFQYDNGPDYPSEGLIRVVKNGKIGYADATSFVIVIEPRFDCAFPFENGKAKVSNQCQTIKSGEHSIWTSDNWQYIDKLGNFL